MYQFVPTLSVVTWAIVCGALWANGLGLGEGMKPGVGFAEKKVLAVAVMLLGLQLDLAAVAALGSRAGWLAVGVVVTIALGFGCARLFGVDRGLSVLVGIGTSICGSSAIVATAPLVTKKPEHVAIALGVINLVGSVGIFFLPALALAIGSSPQASSFIIGGSLQAVGHVAAAGYTVSPEVGQLAVAIKMARVAMLLPLVVVLAVLGRGRAGGGGIVEGSEDSGASTAPVRLQLPNYLYGFVALALAAYLLPVPASILSGAKLVAEVLLAVAMAAVGLRLHARTLVQQGLRALWLGVVLFAVLLGFACFVGVGA